MRRVLQIEIALDAFVECGVAEADAKILLPHAAAAGVVLEERYENCLNGSTDSQ